MSREYLSIFATKISIFASWFYNSLFFTVFVYLLITILAFFVIVKIGLWNILVKNAKIAYVSIKSAYDAHSILTKDFFGTVLVFYIAYQCFEKLAGKSLIANSIVVVLAFAKAYWKSSRIKKGIGKEFESIYDSKLELSRLYQIYTSARPPYYFPTMSNVEAIESLVRNVLTSQVNFIANTFKPGWSWGGHEFSVSVLFFNHSSQSWHLFDTFYEDNAVRRTASTWPIQKNDFVFPEELYTYKSDRIFNITELARQQYESVLQIPLYFRKNHPKTSLQETEYRKGRIYAMVSFASRKKEAFQKVERNSQILRRYFIPEIYILEKYLYKLYRIKVQ